MKFDINCLLFIFICLFTLYSDCKSIYYNTYKHISKCNRNNVLHQTVNNDVNSLTFTKTSTGISAEDTRQSLVKLIEDSWSRVTSLISKDTLVLCENELKGATSLLVLACVKRSADVNPNSRVTVQSIIEDADINQDGQLTYSEWFDWLSRGSISSKSFNRIRSSSSDPMMETISLVLGHAICSLQVVSRFSSEPTMLAAAFISGGLVSGELDAPISKRMLMRLSPDTRDLVTLALTLESASLSSSNAKQLPVHTEVISSSITHSSNDQIVNTIDLSSIPVVTAPPINDPVDNKAISVASNDGFLPIINESPIIRTVDEILNDTKPVVLADIALSPIQIEIDSAEDFEVDSKTDSNIDVVRVDESLKQLSKVWEEVTSLHSSLRDLDDSRATFMRQALLRESGERKDVLGLSMALRATRLQHTTRMTPRKRQQLALETLQLWSPISYQIGLSSQTQELEVHSYVLLFPRSFGSFINWYGNSFRPLAKTFLQKFRLELESKLRRDVTMAKLSKKVTIQSRIKTPPSAFKKMVKNAKKKEDMHDFIGLRLIITPRTVDYNAMYHCLSIINELSDWIVDPNRLKDYIRYPKTSGYQSLHVTLIHRLSGISMEIQIRSDSMHWFAEYGPASHNNYKALILPKTV